MRRRRLLATLGSAVTLSGCATVATPNADYDVGMTATAFDPVELTVERGDEVVWRNTSSRGHTVTAYEGTLPEGAVFFASGGFETEGDARSAWAQDIGGNLTSGDTFSHVFETRGHLRYFCIPHERAGMVGQIVVE